ncbi:phosphatase PAP2 family protein [Nocardia sp. BMG111209]|uniref:phosphatase PAP2 family protein n=1 Tax=Nocardia sp. BMG111209 TaxID=1160137 RepID=UPI0003A07971|nr:phosphatase PAP2 family protein [Nocardia sp. BMG111209]
MIVLNRSSLTRYRVHLAEAGLVLALYAAYDGTRYLVRGGADAAEQDAHTVLRLENLVRLHPEQWLNRLFATHSWLGVPADYLYATLHYVMTAAVLIWLWRAHRTAYRHGRTQLALATVTGLAGFVLFPTMPPRLLTTGEYIDVMSQHAAVGWWADTSAPRALDSMTNDFAAMPSLHVGWAVWCGLMILRHARRPWVRALGAAYPMLILLVVMGTANHYLLDGIAGAVLMLLAGWAATPYLRRFDAMTAALRAPTTPRLVHRAPEPPLSTPATGALGQAEHTSGPLGIRHPTPVPVALARVTPVERRADVVRVSPLVGPPHRKSA